MNPKRLALSIAAIPLMIYAWAYGSVWFQTRESLNRFAAALAPIADFGYGSIHIGLSGTVAVSDLIFSLRQIEGIIRIDRVEVKTPGIDFILHGTKSLNEGKIPQRLGLALTGIRIPSDGPLGDRINTFGGPDRPRPDNGLACGIATIALMEGALKSLRPTQIVTDAAVLMESGVGPGAPKLQLQWRQHGYAALGIELSYRQVGDMLANLGDLAALETVIATATLDQTYVREAQQLCAEKSRLQIDEFVPALLTQNDRAYLQDIGLIPGRGIRSILQGFLDGDEIRAQIAVPEGFAPASMKKYRPEDIPQLLGLQLAQNGSPMTDLSFTTTPAPEPPKPAEVQPRRPQDDLPAELTFANLPRCLDCPVLITLRDGRERRGTVDRTTSGMLYLKQILREGTIIMEIEANDISRIRRLNAQP
ncbi:hypothetical protein [uncultured Thiodictyon sp.]|uniref:hypothetical protein n=1 Tax=uncultured Thiodictyon sp. TaxID=1846217 RepID=UPI0025E18A8E|nr:hypothetical protein [uncultured Thiodictyon sp.]